MARAAFMLGFAAVIIYQLATFAAAHIPNVKACNDGLPTYADSDPRSELNGLDPRQPDGLRKCAP